MRWLAILSLAAVLPATAVRAQQYDTWMMDWFRSPSVNGSPVCVPSHYAPLETEALFRRSGNLRRYSVTPRRDGNVYIFVEKVVKKNNEIVFFESVSDYGWCLAHYQREFWKNAAESQRELARMSSKPEPPMPPANTKQ